MKLLCKVTCNISRQIFAISFIKLTAIMNDSYVNPNVYAPTTGTGFSTGVHVSPPPPPPPAPPASKGGILITTNPGGVHASTTVTTIASSKKVFSKHPASLTCQHCNAAVVTRTRAETGTITWVSAGAMVLFGLWLGCCLIPFCIDDLKDTVHECPNCNRVIDVYKPL